MSEARIQCERCGAVLITNEDDMGEALDDNGWTADAFGDFTCGNCHLADVLNSDDTSGEATDAAAGAVYRLRVCAEKAEAAIARVRERAGGPTPAMHGDWMAGYAAAMRDILRALDDSEDALVQGAITAILSEDAPLIDPDCRDGKHSSCVGGPCQCPCHELAMRG